MLVGSTSISALDLRTRAQHASPDLRISARAAHHLGAGDHSLNSAENTSPLSLDSQEQELKDAQPSVYSDPRVQAGQKLQQTVDVKQQSLEAQQIQKLAARDREVRTHEQAHQAAAGQYAGAVSYQFQRGPNGVSYAVGGEVPISTGKESTPEATLLKAQMVRRAALAPAEPSGADRAVAAEASKLEMEALVEIAAKRLKAPSKESPQREDKPSLETSPDGGIASSKEELGTSESESSPANSAAKEPSRPSDGFIKSYRFTQESPESQFYQLA